MQSEEILALRRRKFIRFFSFDKRDDSRERKRSGNELIAESEIGRQLLRSMTHDDYIQTLTTARQQIDIAPLPDELGGFRTKIRATSEFVVGWKQLSGKCRRWWVFARCGKQKSNAKVKFTFRAHRPELPNLSKSVPKVNLSRFRTSVKSFPALRACKFPPAWFRSSRQADDGSAAGTGPPRRRNSLKEPEEAPSHLLNDIDL
ncbi:hypothetical protein HZH68_008372 [Vespula germanica]|uniref:Uncharacterized protein n=1 Tax=Vespula germanica TaxID=30212 RepID=A0A834N7K3_VESGE|nr:hypothetical protein HZH68_008372 [Vespula germanica]